MSATIIRELFSNDIFRQIEEVIKVDQTDEQIIRDELAEYVVTDSIRGHMTEILERYLETPNKPHEGIGVWVSGFFGSGKSSFAKYLGLGLENRPILGEGAGRILGLRTSDAKMQVVLSGIAERIPTEAVIFDVSTDRGIRSGSQSITEIMYRLFLKHLGYAGELDLAELEITLEADGRLDEFQAKFQELFHREWDDAKGLIAIAVQQASRVMHELEPDTYATVDSWRESAKGRADITPGELANRAVELMGRRRPGRALLFVVDEVGQFVARDVQKMLDLQAVVQSLGRVGRGKLWLVVTSQEKLTELVSGLDNTKVELARLMDRFPLQVHLEPSDISEVTSRRVLSKNADAERTLREVFAQHQGRLTDNTRITADIKLPELTAQSFIDLYPLLPYQVDLIIEVVSGLRTQGGSSKHVGGANRTIIKLAQQLLVRPDVDLANAPVGTLARADQVYDLISGNIASDLRGKIDAITRHVEHPLAPAVAKTMCLLQYVRSVHRTAENIAAALHPAVYADSRLAEVRTALEALEHAHLVRRGNDGYRIPSPAEDDWERQRTELSPKPGDVNRLHAELIAVLWQPQPAHTLLGVKAFKAGLYLNGHQVAEGDIPFHLTLAEAGHPYAAQVEESRRRSQQEPKAAFWAAALDPAIDRETVELFRSKEMVTRKERSAQTKDESALVAEEKLRQRQHQEELRRLLRQALLAGAIFFRGNDRSPDDTVAEVTQAAVRVLTQTLPQVFDRFAEAAAKVGGKDLDALLTMENLRGLPPVFGQLHLLRDEAGRPVLDTESGPLAEVLGRIRDRFDYGESASGRYLADELAKEPFGWEFDTVQLLTVALVRAGAVEATSKGQVIESALSVEARATFTNNNLFRQASFRPKVGVDFPAIADAAQHFKEVFGREIPELEQGVVSAAIREELNRHEPGMQEMYTTLLQHSLPGVEVLKAALDELRTMRRGKDDQTILSFNGCYKGLKEAIRRVAELEQQLTEPGLYELDRARHTLQTKWPFLAGESDVTDADRERAEKLADLMQKDTFFREMPAVYQYTHDLTQEYRRRHQAAAEARAAAYASALVRLQSTPGWDQIDADQQARIAAPLVGRAEAESGQNVDIPLLRADVDACPTLLQKAVEDALRLIDGHRVVKVSAATYFTGGIDTEEQLEMALQGLRDECLELIGTGKKVLVQ
jgi:hypothetical protein